MDAYYARDLLDMRSTLHLALRLGVRLTQVLIASGGASEHAGLWRAALPLFVVLDVAIWLHLRRTDSFGVAWRLPLDAVDAAFWAMSPLPASGNYDWSILIAIPLGIEAGVRMEWRGLVVPAVVFVSTSLAVTLVGKPIRIMGTWWIAVGVVMGVAFLHYCRLLDRRAEAQRHRAQAAGRRRAYLAGQNQVAMGASSAVDVIEGLVPVLGRPEPGSALWRLADGWKSQLSASTAQEATYLKVALLEWERGHNRHPDLSGLVEVHIDEGQGTTLLSAAQARQLAAALDRLDLRGPVTVRISDIDPGRLPGQPLTVDVGGREVTVPADARAGPPTIDPCAVTYLYMAVFFSVGMFPDLGGLPAPAVAAGVTTCAVIGVVSHRRIVRRGETAQLGVFSLAVVAATVLTLLGAFAGSPVSADGEPIFGFGPGLLLLAFLGGFYWRSLAGWRWLFPAAVAGNVALGLLLFGAPSSISVRALAASVLWSFFPYFPCRHLATALTRARARHAVSVHTRDEGAEQLAFLEGRESVVGLVRQAHDDAIRRLRELTPRIDAGLAQFAAGRLEEVERRLRTTPPARGSWSSTTTG